MHPFVTCFGVDMVAAPADPNRIQSRPGNGDGTGGGQPEADVLARSYGPLNYVPLTGPKPAAAGRLVRWMGWVELALGVVLGLMVARLLYAIVAPLEVPATLPGPGDRGADFVAADTAAGPVNPFRVAGASAIEIETVPSVVPETLAETSLDLVLHGVRVDESGVSAIIRTADGRQRNVPLGGEIADGVFLDSARDDQVTIRRAGIRETLTMVNRERRGDNPTVGTGPASEASAAQAGVGDSLAAENVDVGAWSSFVSVRPRPVPGGVEMVLGPAGQGDRFAAAGLQDGDVIVSIDGIRLGRTPGSIADQMKSLSGARTVDLVVDRNGAQLPVKIFLKPGRGDVNDY